MKTNHQPLGRELSMGMPGLSADSGAGACIAWPELAGTVERPPGGSDILHALNLEFERAVCSPAEIQTHGTWVPGTPVSPAAHTSPDLEHLVDSSDHALLLRDVLDKRASIDEAMASIGALDGDVALPLVRDEEVLSLFAPALATAADAKVPELTRREHHALSPDSPVHLGHPLICGSTP